MNVPELRPSAPKFALALLLLGALTLLLFALGISPDMPILSRIFLLALAAGSAWITWRMFSAASSGLTFGPQGLITLEGELIAPIDTIEDVERGTFAFKPSSGFTLRLSARQPARWVPGLWWRRGRRVGVGGVTHRGAGRMLAEEIALRLAQNKAGDRPSAE